MHTYKPSKRWEIAVWTHKRSGMKLTLYYDKACQKFWGRVGHETVEHETQVEAKRLLQKAADATLFEEERWERVIFLNVSDRCSQTGYTGYERGCSHVSPQVGFTCWRAWRLVAWNGEVLTRAWDRDALTPSDQTRLAEGRDVTRLSVYDKRARMLPYSDEVWERLLEFSKRLGDLQDELGRVLHSDDFVARLTSGLNASLTGKTAGEKE